MRLVSDERGRGVLIPPPTHIHTHLPHMVDQMLLPREGLVAHIATVRIVSTVLTHVIVEMLLPRERFVAVLTFVR